MCCTGCHGAACLPANKLSTCWTELAAPGTLSDNTRSCEQQENCSNVQELLHLPQHTDRTQNAFTTGTGVQQRVVKLPGEGAADLQPLLSATTGLHADSITVPAGMRNSTSSEDLFRLSDGHIEGMLPMVDLLTLLLPT
jgi:hypothetical protein